MADVKFSELSELAAADVASNDILAVVDTGASTSKRLSIESLFAQVPVSIAVNDATDTSSGATGSIQTDGGIGIAKKLFVGTTSTLTGASTLTGEVTVGTGIIADAQDGAYLGSSTRQFSDLFLADAATIALGDDGDVVLTHVADAGVMLNTTMAMRWRDATLGVNSSVDGQLDIYADAELEVTAPIVDIDASTGIALDGANLNSAWTVNLANKIQWRDTGLYINSSTNGQLDVVADVEAQIVAPTVDIDASTGIALDGANLITAWTVGTTNKIQFRDTGLFIQSSTDGQLDVQADAELEITAPIVDIDASTGIALDGANLNSAWLVNTTNQIRFHDTGQHIAAPADGRLAITSDGDIELTATDIKVGLASQDGNIQALTNAYDLTLKQYDGFEVARITDGGKAAPTGFTLLQTEKGGFGHRRPVIAWATADTATSTLTLAESGSIIVMDLSANYADLITLPAVVAADVGAFFTFVVGTGGGPSAAIVKILTASQAGGQGFQLDAFNAAGGSGDEHIRTAWAAGNDFLTLPASTPVGTTVDLVCVVGGAGTMWLATSYTTGVTIAVSTS